MTTISEDRPQLPLGFQDWCTTADDTLEDFVSSRQLSTVSPPVTQGSITVKLNGGRQPLGHRQDILTSLAAQC